MISSGHAVSAASLSGGPAARAARSCAPHRAREQMVTVRWRPHARSL